MFDGEVAAIQVIDRLGPCKGFTSCYDENWQLIENVNIYYSKGAYQPPPEGLKEMAEKAKGKGPMNAGQQGIKKSGKK